MYDPKFEKAIQQKMEELEFRPPESVWVNIEKAVVVKRRRRAGFLWRYLLPGVMVVAAAGLYWHYAFTPAKLAGGTSALAGHSSAVSLAAKSGSSTPEARSSMAGRNTSEGQTATGGGIAANHSSGVGHSGTVGHLTRAGRSSNTDETAADGQLPVAGQTTAFGETETAGQIGSGERTGSGGRTGLAGRAPTAGQNELAPWLYMPGLADQRLAPQVHASTLSTKKSNSIAVAGLSHPQRHWEAGFVAGGGLSRLNRLNSDQARVALDPTTTSFYAISNASSSSSHYIADVRSEASFEGGIYLQRPLSDRWIVNTGMNLHYYSNRISVGEQVTTYVQPSVSLLVPTVQTTTTASMYSAGDTRSMINKYYFLELPVGLQWKVNKSHLVPIFVEGGVSLSRLMGASALFYNAKTGLYSKDGDIVNKTQFNLESALLVGLPFHGVNIQLGPQIQYGLTALVNTQGVGDQHLLYTGIRLVVIPGRK